MSRTRRFLAGKLLRFYARIVHEKATPEYIARGWAIGMFCGCLLPFGIQLVVSLPAAFLLRGSKIGAALGTLLTNHFTIFFIYPLQCYVGSRLLGDSLSLDAIRTAMEGVLREESFESLRQLGWHLTAAFFLGGALLCAIMTPLTYWGVKALVVRRRRRRQEKIENNILTDKNVTQRSVRERIQK